jgi:hypothetical protein
MSDRTAQVAAKECGDCGDFAEGVWGMERAHKSPMQPRLPITGGGSCLWWGRWLTGRAVKKSHGPISDRGASPLVQAGITPGCAGGRLEAAPRAAEE